MRISVQLEGGRCSSKSILRCRLSVLRVHMGWGRADDSEGGREGFSYPEAQAMDFESADKLVGEWTLRLPPSGSLSSSLRLVVCAGWHVSMRVPTYVHGSLAYQCASHYLQLLRDSSMYVCVRWLNM